MGKWCVELKRREREKKRKEEKEVVMDGVQRKKSEEGREGEERMGERIEMRLKETKDSQ